MDKYSKVSGRHTQDYDELDIEGRDDMEEKKRKKDEEQEEKELLNIKVPTTDNSYGFIFSVRTDGDTKRWRCHLCDIVVVGQAHVSTHIQTKKHQVRLTMPVHPASLFSRFHNKPEEAAGNENAVVNPGQPAPPGCEESLQTVTQLQATLDQHSSSPLIGLEYLVEIAPEEEGREPTYVCMLCDKKGDPRVVMAHLSSFNHCSKYISIHFPTVNRKMSRDIPRSKEGRKAVADIVHKLCLKIEEQYGRLRPVPITKDTFENHKDALIKQLVASRHLMETPDCTFEDMVDTAVLSQFVNPGDVPVPEGLPPANEEENKDMSQKQDGSDNNHVQKKEVDRNSPASRKTNSTSAADDNKSNDSLGKKSTMNRSRMKMRDEDKAEEIKLKYGDRDSKREVIEIKDTSSVSSEDSPPSKSRSRSPKSRTEARFRGSVYGRSNYRDRYRRRRTKSRSRSRSRGRRSRSHSPHSRRRRSSRGASPRETERTKWEKYRQRVDAVERELNKEMQFHAKNPEKHPSYPDEWKKFWNRRYKELQAEGKDPSKHDFKPEWIEFWNQRMQEMHTEELRQKKEEIRQVLGLPRDAGDGPRWVLQRSPTPEKKKDVTVADIKNTWKAMTGSEIKEPRQSSPSPREDGRGGFGPGGRNFRRGPSGFGRPLPETVRVVTVLRLLIAMENQLGSLGPRVNDLMTAALSLEKVSQNSSDTLLLNPDHMVLFETVREKFKGQLLAGIVERHMVGATRRCLDYLSELLARANTFPQSARQEKVSHSQVGVSPVMQSMQYVSPAPYTAAVTKPVPVPGVGTVDRVAIAQQIAAALIAQGKTDVTEDQLEQLIAAVVGMAQAQAAAGNKPISTAQYLEQLQQGSTQQVSAVPVTTIAAQSPAPPAPASVPTLAPAPTPTPVSTPVSAPAPVVPTPVPITPPPTMPPVKPPQHSVVDSPVSALQLLQSAYNEGQARGARSPVREEPDSMAELSDVELQTLLHNFKNLSTEEQHQLILYLKKLEAVEPDKVERLRKFVNLGPPGLSTPAPAPAPAPAPSPAPERPMLHDVPGPMFQHSSGRLSPFSMREAGINPSQEERPGQPTRTDDYSDDDDDDYSYEDVFAAASKKVQEKEQEELRRKMEEERKKKEEEEEQKRKLEEEKRLEEERRYEETQRLEAAKQFEEEKRFEEERKRKFEDETRLEEEKRRRLENERRYQDPIDDPGAVLRKTNAMIANIMDELPSKYGARINSPAMDPFQRVEQQWNNLSQRDGSQTASFGQTKELQYGNREAHMSANTMAREVQYGGREAPMSASPMAREVQYGGREAPISASPMAREIQYGGREAPMSASPMAREMYDGREMHVRDNLASREVPYGSREAHVTGNPVGREMQYAGREALVHGNPDVREIPYGGRDALVPDNPARTELPYGSREAPASINPGFREMQYGTREEHLPDDVRAREAQAPVRKMYADRNSQQIPSLSGRQTSTANPYGMQYGGYQGYGYGGAPGYYQDQPQQEFPGVPQYPAQPYSQQRPADQYGQYPDYY